MAGYLNVMNLYKCVSQRMYVVTATDEIEDKADTVTKNYSLTDFHFKKSSSRLIRCFTGAPILFNCYMLQVRVLQYDDAYFPFASDVTLDLV